MQPTERHVFSGDQSPLNGTGQQVVLPRQVVQVLLERLILELHRLHDLQVAEQVRLVVVLDRERRLFHQVRYLRLIQLFDRPHVVERLRDVQRRGRGDFSGRLRGGRLFCSAGREREKKILYIMRSIEIKKKLHYINLVFMYV